MRKGSIVVFIFCICLLMGNNVALSETEGLVEIASQEEMRDGLIITGPKAMWKTIINGKLSAGLSTPLYIYKGSCYIFLKGKPSDIQNGYICAVNSNNGAEQWVRTIGGIYENPLFDDNALYFGSPDGYMYSLSTATGEELWKKKTENWASSGMRVPPIPDEKNIYFGYDDGILYALDKKTGKEKWQYDVGGTIYARPLLLEGNLYFGTSAGKVYSVDTQTGEKKWETTIQPDIFFLNLLHEEGKIVLLWCDSPPGEYQERKAVSFSGLDVKTGEMKWTTTWETQEVMSWPIAAFNTLFVTIGKELKALDFDTGETKWNFISKNAFYPALSIRENFLLAFEGKSFYDKADTSSSVYVINCETGERNWEYEAAGGIEKGADSSGRLIAVSSQHMPDAGIEKSTVSFVDKLTGKEQGSIVIKEGEIVDQPVVSHGNLFYITTKDQEGNSYIYKLKWKD